MKEAYRGRRRYVRRGGCLFTIMAFGLMFVTSCAMVDYVKDAFDVTYEVGKARGRQEVLKDIEETKKKLDDLNGLVLQEMALLVTKTQDDRGGDKIIEFVIPITANWLVLKKKVNNLRKELKVADAKTGKED